MRTVSFDLPADHVDKVESNTEFQSADSLLATIQEIHATDRFYLSELDTILLYEPDLATKDAIEVIKNAHAQLVTLTLGELHKWPKSLSSAYRKYLDCYSYKADDSERYAYLRKRPFTRLSYLSKMIRRVEHGLDRDIGSTMLQELAAEARTLIQTQMDQVDSNTFYFSKVVSFETFEPVGAAFDPRTIIFRDIMQFQLLLPSGNWSNKITVELLMLSNKSLGICSLENPGRALMFPTFRSGDLQVIVDEVAPLNIRSKNPNSSRKSNKQPNYHSINLQSCHLEPPKCLRLRSTNQKLINDWSRRLNEVFGSISSSSATVVHSNSQVSINSSSLEDENNTPDALGIRVFNRKQHKQPSFKRLSLGLGGSIGDFGQLKELLNAETSIEDTDAYETAQSLIHSTSNSTLSSITSSRSNRDLLAPISELATTPDLKASNNDTDVVNHSNNNPASFQRKSFSLRTTKTAKPKSQHHAASTINAASQRQVQGQGHVSDDSKSSIDEDVLESEESSHTSLSSLASDASDSDLNKANNNHMVTTASTGYKLRFDPKSSLYLYNTSNPDFNNKLSQGNTARAMPSQFPPLPGTPTSLEDINLDDDSNITNEVGKTQKDDDIFACDPEASTETLCAPKPESKSESKRPPKLLKVPRVPVGSAGNSPVPSPILSRAPKLPPPQPPVVSSESYDEIKPLLASSGSHENRLVSEDSVEVIRARQLRQSINEVDNSGSDSEDEKQQVDHQKSKSGYMSTSSSSSSVSVNHEAETKVVREETSDSISSTSTTSIASVASDSHFNKPSSNNNVPATSTPVKTTQDPISMAPQVEHSTAELVEEVSTDADDQESSFDTTMNSNFSTNEEDADDTANTTVSSIGRSLSATPKKFAKRFRGTFKSLVRRRKDHDQDELDSFDVLEPKLKELPEELPDDLEEVTEPEPEHKLKEQVSDRSGSGESPGSTSNTDISDSKSTNSAADTAAPMVDNSAVVTLFRGLCTPKKWKGPNWVPISEGELAVQVCVTGQGGVLYAGTKAKLNLLPSHEIRKSTAHDVQITQGAKATMFRFKSQDSAGRFYEALQMSRVDVRQQPLLYFPANGVSSNPPSLNSGDSSLGSLSSLEPPPPKSMLGNNSMLNRRSLKRLGSTGTVSTIFEEEEEEDDTDNDSTKQNARTGSPAESSNMTTPDVASVYSGSASKGGPAQDPQPTLLLLNNLRCKLHGQNIQGQWTAGEVARLSVFSVANSTAKSILIRPLYSNEPLLYETNMESQSFARVGKVGISVALDDNPPRWMLQFKGEKEVSHVYELFQNE